MARTKPALAAGVAYTQVKDEGLLVSPTKGEIYITNELGVFIVSLINSTRTIDDIVEEVVSEYEVERDVAAQDVTEFLAELEQKEAIVYVE